ncbi:histone acetyltransferase 1 [Coemansia sp. RSA 552]|nr:histone acetyltransferase 1 [Coemansia sp. RSA 552]
MDATLAANASQWAAASNEALHIRLISGETERGVLKALNTDISEEEQEEGDEGGADVIEFHPEFTYPIYGEHERVFGYKGLRLQLSYAAGSLATYFSWSYAKRIDDMETSLAVALKADDVEGPMRAVLADGAVSGSAEEFAQRVARDTREFRPAGRKVHEYTRSGDAGAGESLVYEIYEGEFGDADVRRYHERMQTMVLFFIEGAQFVDAEDERWRVFTVFERLDMAGQGSSYSLVGFCTMYRFYHWPDQRRARIAQFLVLPPFQGQGHGSELYRYIYSMVVASPEYVDLTVEDPSEAFDDMRDCNDMRNLLKHDAFSGIGKDPLAISRATVQGLQTKYKLSKRQMTRCLEMALLMRISGEKTEAFARYRLLVKRRIFAQNTDLLQGLDPEEKKEKVAASFAAVVDDYRRIISLL